MKTTKLFLLLTALLTLSFAAEAQTTAPMVLGCANPAPAAAGKPTVFFTKCTTPAFVATTSSSAVASVSKTAPVWAHSFSGYPATTAIYTCPAGATVAGATCTYNGADASVLVAQSAVSSSKVTPATCPDTFLSLSYTCSFSADHKTVTCTAPVQPQ